MKELILSIRFVLPVDPLQTYMMSDFICEDMIDEIFSRLPLKSILRFRSLSKFLYRYIASHGFTRKHTSRSPQKILIRHRPYYNDFHKDPDFYTLHSDDELPLCPKRRYNGTKATQFPFKRNNFFIVGSCNGILCIFEYNLRSKFKYDLINLSLWNPSTGRKLTLPDFPQRRYTRMEIGFGFDKITDDYKIVILSNPDINEGTPQSSLVYAMKTRIWCTIAPPNFIYTKVASNGCFVNGELHWVVERYNGRRRYILTFDLSTHVFGMIVLPQFRYTTKQLTTINGSLTVISVYMFGIWIWVRRDDSWFLVFSSKRNKLQGGLKRILQTTTNGDFLFKTMLGRAHLYYPKIGKQSRLVNFNSASNICDMQLCVESLEWIDMETTFEVE